MVVLVCGGRDFEDYDALSTALYEMNQTRRITKVVSGRARGADALGELWARRNGVPVAGYPADWATHGKAAGPIRNQTMLDREQPEAVVACKGGRGTADMVHRAEKARIPVTRIGW